MNFQILSIVFSNCYILNILQNGVLEGSLKKLGRHGNFQLILFKMILNVTIFKGFDVIFISHILQGNL